MIKQIKCEVCEEVMGAIEKNIITEEDISLYLSMFSCSAGHSNILLEDEE